MKTPGIVKLIYRLACISKRAIDIYGWQHQYSQSIEEKAELIVELSHAKRKDKQICLNKLQLEIIHDLIMNIQLSISAFPNLFSFMLLLARELKRLDKRLNTKI